jgi:hypothetical protein
VLVYDNDWSSSIAFASKRKTATLPAWMPGYRLSFKDPGVLFGKIEPQAIVSCVNKDKNLMEWTDVSKAAQKAHLFAMRDVNNCQIWSR